MCAPTAPTPPAVPPPPPPPSQTADKIAAAPGVAEAQKLAARLGTASLQIPYAPPINIPR